MLSGLDQFACQDLAVPVDVMEHVVRVESSFNPFAIGVVGGRLARQPKELPEALATARMLEEKGFNFSLGLSQINRHNLADYGLASYEAAFQPCANLRAGSQILAECHQRTGGDWGKAFSCYYSGNMVTGFRHGYVQKVFASMRAAEMSRADDPIRVIGRPSRRDGGVATGRPGDQPSGAGTGTRTTAVAVAKPVASRTPSSSAPDRSGAGAPGGKIHEPDRAFVF